MTELSPAATAVWEAFNEDEAGVFVDYGEKLAAALRAAADQVVPANGSRRNNEIRTDLLAIADELEDLSDGPAVSSDREPASITNQLTNL